MSTYKQDQSNTVQECSHGGCNCQSDQYGGVTKGEIWFCSQGCVEGSGCDHADCHCNRMTNHNPEHTRAAPSIPGQTTKPVPKANPGQYVDHNPGQGSPATRRQP